MKLRHGLNVMYKAICLGFRQVFATKIVLLGSFLVYSAIMLLYSGVIKMIPLADIAPYGLSHAQMIWYMGTVELALFCTASWVFKEVQYEIKTEGVHLSLLRPFPSALLKISLWFGESLARLCLYIPASFVLLTALTGSFYLSFFEVIGILVAMPIAIIMILCGWFFVGASCLWFGQSEPAYFFWQKFVFLFGALLWPIALYPDWLQPILWAMPFPAMLATVGNWMLDYSFFERALMVLHQIGWGIAFLYLLKWYDKKVLVRIQKGEG